LFDAVYYKYMFERYMWGVKETAKETLKNADEMFSKMRLYPLFKLYTVTDTDDDDGHPGKADAALIESCNRLMTVSPELFPSALWLPISRCVPPGAVPKVDSWFDPRILFGTVYNFDTRRYRPFSARLLSWRSGTNCRPTIPPLRIV
jgi:hypothetical protein